MSTPADWHLSCHLGMGDKFLVHHGPCTSGVKYETFHGLTLHSSCPVDPGVNVTSLKPLILRGQSLAMCP